MELILTWLNSSSTALSGCVVGVGMSVHFTLTCGSDSVFRIESKGFGEVDPVGTSLKREAACRTSLRLDSCYVQYKEKQ